MPKIMDSAASGNRNSKAVYWPGGEGHLDAVGSLNGGTITLYWGPPMDGTDAITSGNYKAQGATITTDNGSNRFAAGRGCLYAALSGSSGSDACDVYITGGDPAQDREIRIVAAESTVE